MVKAKKKRISQAPQKEKLDKKKHALQIGLSLFMVLILFGSIFGTFGLQNTSGRTKETYNGQTFVYENNVWQTQLPGVEQETQFLYYPGDVATAPYEESFDQLREYRTISFVSDPDAALIQETTGIGYRLINPFREGLGTNAEIALSKPNEYDLPVINCTSVNQMDTDQAALIFNESQDFGYEQVGDCYIINARNTNEFHLLTDRIVYELFGIMDE